LAFVLPLPCYCNFPAIPCCCPFGKHAGLSFVSPCHFCTSGAWLFIYLPFQKKKKNCLFEFTGLCGEQAIGVIWPVDISSF